MEIVSISTCAVSPSPVNPRKSVSGIKELAESIKRHGLIHPITVRPDADGYEIISGHRRFAAVKLNGDKQIPAFIRNLDSADAYEITLAENFDREDLTPMEEARGIQSYYDIGLDTPAIAAKMGRSPQWVARRRSLLSLSPKWIEILENDETAAHNFTSAHLELIARYSIERQNLLLDDFEYCMDEYRTVADLRAMLDRKHRLLSSSPWALDDETLYPEAGACTRCQKCSLSQPLLFDPPADEDIDEKKIEKGQCLDSDCYDQKQAAFVKLAISEKKSKYPGMLTISKDSIYRSGGPLSTVAPSTLRRFEYDRCKKSDKGAKPAMVISGKNAGKIEWILPRAHVSANQSINSNTEKPKQSLVAKIGLLTKRRIIRTISKIICILKGIPHTDTGLNLKPDICRFCNGKLENYGYKNCCDSCRNTHLDKWESECDENVSSLISSTENLNLFALACAFGTSQNCPAGPKEDFDDYSPDLPQWEAIYAVLGFPMAQAKIQFGQGLFESIFRQLHHLCNDPLPSLSLPLAVCRALNINIVDLWKASCEEIKIPRSWPADQYSAEEINSFPKAKENTEDE